MSLKGSIIDELRKLDWVPRSLRSKSNQLKEKTLELEGQDEELGFYKELLTVLQDEEPNT